MLNSTECPINLRLDRLFSRPPLEIIPTMDEVLPVGSVVDALAAHGGIPLSCSNQLNSQIFEKGLRPCDTPFQVGKQTVPLWRIEVPASVDKSFHHRTKKGLVQRGINQSKVPCEHSRFLQVLKSTLDELERRSVVTIDQESSSRICERKESEDLRLFETIVEWSQLERSDPRRRVWDRCLKLLFSKGHKFSKAEQSIMALHINMCSFTKLTFGLPSNHTVFASYVIAALLNPDLCTKSYKAFMADQEYRLTEFIGDLPYSADPLDPCLGRIFELVMEQPPFERIRPGSLNKLDVNQIGRFLSCFAASRNHPAPDDASVVAEYEKYLALLTTEDHVGSFVSHDEVMAWVDGPIGQSTDAFLSRCLAGRVLEEAAKLPDGKASSILNGTSTPQVPLGTQADFDSKRKDGGHYGYNNTHVLPFLKMKTVDLFPFVATLGDGREFIASDTGFLICPIELSELPLWKSAFVASEQFDEDDVLLAFKEDVSCSSHDRLGLDGRYGSLLFLYSIYTCRPWLETLDALEADGIDVCKLSEDQVLDLCSKKGFTFPKNRTVPVLEPGGKTRWVSAAEFASVIYQMPLAEDLRQLYSCIESAKTGLLADNHLFRYEQSFADHTLHKMLTGREHPLDPTDIANSLTGISESGGTEDDLRIHLHLVIGRTLSKEYRIPLLSGLASTLPLGDTSFHKSLLVEIYQQEDYAEAIMEWFSNQTRFISYEDLDAAILATPELREMILVTTTTDMVKATDTILHRVGKRYMTDFLKELRLI